MMNPEENKSYSITGSNQVNPTKNSQPLLTLIDHDLTTTMDLLDMYTLHKQLPDNNIGVEDFLFRIRYHIETAYCRFQFVIDHSNEPLDGI